jgi:dephospho-CoA kinase
MRTPVMVVTGGIGSGKTTVAGVLAGGHGRVVDCDELAHRALESDPVKERLVRVFGEGIITRSGRVSRARLARLVFSEDARLAALERIVRPAVSRIISDEVRRLRSEYPYIVLDAVVYFNYKFRFKVDLVVLTEAPERTRLRRIMKRDGMSRERALGRIERQRSLRGSWAKADVVLNTGRSRREVERAAASIRDRFFEDHPEIRRMKRWKRE